MRDEVELKFLNINPKVIELIRKKHQGILVGFKAEWNVPDDVLSQKAKLRSQEIGLDLIVANDVSRTTTNENHVLIIDRSGHQENQSGSKWQIAESILDRTVSL